MPPVLTKSFTRVLNAEHVIGESNELMSREQIILVASTIDYPPGSVLAKITGGADVGKWGMFDPNGANGLNAAKGILFARRRLSTETSRAVAHVRDSRINGKKIFWGPGVTTDNQKTAAIAALAARDAAGYGNVQVGF